MYTLYTKIKYFFFSKHEYILYMLKVIVKDKNINGALKELKSKFIKTKVTKQLFDRKNFKRKGIERREEIQKAIYREKMKRKDD